MADLTATTLALSPAAYYRLNDTSGTTAVDSAATPHAGTYSATGVTLGSPPLTTNDAGASLLDGVYGRVNLPVAAQTVIVAAGTTMSVSAWVRWANVGTSPRVVASGHSDMGDPGSFQLYYTNLAWTFDGRSTAGGYAGRYISATPTVGAIYHLVGVWDSANGMQIYVNGSSAGSLPNTGNTLTPGSLGSTTFGVSFGVNPSYNGDFANATIGEVAFFTTALTAAQVTSLYQAGTAAVSAAATGTAVGNAAYTSGAIGTGRSATCIGNG